MHLLINMKKTEKSPGSKRSAGNSLYAAAVLFLSLSAVLVSVILLFDFVSGIFRDGDRLGENFQAVLTEESAVELLAASFLEGSVHDYSVIPSFTVGGQKTVFTVTGTSSIPPETLTFPFRRDSLLEVLPLRGAGAVLVSRAGDSICVDMLQVGNAPGIIELLGVPWDDRDVIGLKAEMLDDGVHVYFLAMEPGGGESFLELTPDGAIEVSEIRLPPDPVSGNLREVAVGDYDGDGAADTLSITVNAAMVICGDGGTYSDSIPGARMVAWSIACDDAAPCFRWTSGDGRDRWRIFSGNGFEDLDGIRNGLRNRAGEAVHVEDDSAMGPASGFITVDASGERVPSSSPGVLLCDVNGGGVDAVRVREGRLEVAVDPMEGNGLLVEVSSVTALGNDDVLLRSSWGYRIYGTGSGKRIRWERWS